MAVVVTMPGQRPEPPQNLGDRERVIWKKVVAAHPYDWFHSSVHSLLADYCRAWVHADSLAEALAKYDAVPVGDELKVWLKLCDRQDKNARLVTTLATKMRLTQQSMRTERNAASGVKQTAQDQKKPWEFGKEDGAG